MANVKLIMPIVIRQLNYLIAIFTSHCLDADGGEDGEETGRDDDDDDDYAGWRCRPVEGFSVGGGGGAWNPCFRYC